MRIPRSIKAFFCEENGFLLSSESIFLGTIGVIGMVVGLAEVRNAVAEEFGDFAQAVAFLTQDYSYTSVESSNSGDIQTFGSLYEDIVDDQAGDGFAGIFVATAGDTEV